MAEVIHNIVLRLFRKCTRLKFQRRWLKCLECSEKFDYALRYLQQKAQMSSTLSLHLHGLQQCDERDEDLPSRLQEGTGLELPDHTRRVSLTALAIFAIIQKDLIKDSCMQLCTGRNIKPSRHVSAHGRAPPTLVIEETRMLCASTHVHTNGTKKKALWSSNATACGSHCFIRLFISQMKEVRSKMCLEPMKTRSHST